MVGQGLGLGSRVEGGRAIWVAAPRCEPRVENGGRSVMVRVQGEGWLGQRWQPRAERVRTQSNPGAGGGVDKKSRDGCKGSKEG